MSKVFFIFLFFFAYSCPFVSGQEYAIEPFPPKAGKKSVTLYKSYYNSFNIVVKNTPIQNLELYAKGFEIRKHNNIFYIRLVKPIHSDYVKIYNKKILIDSFYVHINSDIPLPLLSYFKERSGEFYKWCSFDSIKIENVFRDRDNPFKFNEYQLDKKMFKLLFYNVSIEESGKVVFSEFINGNQYSELFKITIDTYAIHRRKYDVIRIKNATIQDDLGNIYVYPDLIHLLGCNY
jgi:hypothetical protein